MDFTETEAEILVNCWLLAREGKGQVVEEWAMPDAQRLSAAGWLEQRTVDATGDTAWFWTQEAETALDVSALNQTVEGRDNRCAGGASRHSRA